MEAQIMTSNKITSGLLATLTVLAAVSFAQPEAQAQYGSFVNPRFHSREQVRIDRMQARLSARLEQARVSGALTAFEARRLRARLAQIAMLEARYKADGRLAPWEANVLSSRLDNLRIALGREINDRQFASRNFRWF
jgi:hypothetical protein